MYSSISGLPPHHSIASNITSISFIIIIIHVAINKWMHACVIWAVYYDFMNRPKSTFMHYLNLGRRKRSPTGLLYQGDTVDKYVHTYLLLSSNSTFIVIVQYFYEKFTKIHFMSQYFILLMVRRGEPLSVMLLWLFSLCCACRD